MIRSETCANQGKAHPTHLRHEPSDDSVQDRSLIVQRLLRRRPDALLAGAEASEVLRGQRRGVGVQLDVESSGWSAGDADVEEDTRVQLRLVLQALHSREAVEEARGDALDEPMAGGDSRTVMRRADAQMRVSEGLQARREGGRLHGRGAGDRNLNAPSYSCLMLEAAAMNWQRFN
jgi:hypothetical protein